MTGPKRIYFDTRDWITLARVANGLEKDSELVEIYEKIKKLSESGAAIFPISFFHLEDMMINSDEEQRNKLIDFMISISKGWVLQPYSFYTNKELYNAVLHRLGKDSKYNIRDEILSKGLAYLISTGYDITWNKTAKVPNDFEAKLREAIDSPASLVLILKDEKISNRFKQFRRETIDMATKMETNRKQKMTWPKDKRYATSIAIYLDDVVVPRLASLLMGVEKPIRAKIIPTTKETMEQFLEDQPSTNIVFRLTYARDEFYQREVKPNDIADINHLSIAIPYCDIVVMERMFASASIQLGLDKKYGCTICRSLKDLNKII